MAYDKSDTSSGATIYSGSYTGKARVKLEASITYPSDSTYKISYKVSLQLYNREEHTYTVTEPDGSSHSGTSASNYPGSRQWYTSNSWTGSVTGNRKDASFSKSVSASGSVYSTSKGSKVSVGSASISFTVKAKPTPAVTTYTLTATADTGGSVSPTSSTVASGTSVTLTAAAYSGYQFSYWYINGSYYYSQSVSVTVTSNMTATAYFSEIITYTYLYFYTDTGSYVGAKIVDYGTPIGTLPSAPSKAGYRFKYWADPWGDQITSSTYYWSTSDSSAYAVYEVDYNAPYWLTCSAERVNTTDLKVNLNWYAPSQSTQPVTRIDVKYSADGGTTWLSLESITSSTILRSGSYTQTYTNKLQSTNSYILQYVLWDNTMDTGVGYSDFITTEPYFIKIPSETDANPNRIDVGVVTHFNAGININSNEGNVKNWVTNSTSDNNYMYITWATGERTRLEITS